MDGKDQSELFDNIKRTWKWQVSLPLSCFESYTWMRLILQPKPNNASEDEGTYIKEDKEKQVSSSTSKVVNFLPVQAFGRYWSLWDIWQIYLIGNNQVWCGDWEKIIVKITSIAFVCLGSVSTHEPFRHQLRCNALWDGHRYDLTSSCNPSEK